MGHNAMPCSLVYRCPMLLLLLPSHTAPWLHSHRGKSTKPQHISCSGLFCSTQNAHS